MSNGHDKGCRAAHGIGPPVAVDLAVPGLALRSGRKTSACLQIVPYDRLPWSARTSYSIGPETGIGFPVARDEESMKRFSARIPLYVAGIDRVYEFRLIQPEFIAIYRDAQTERGSIYPGSPK